MRGANPATFGPSDFVVNTGDNVVCTITNTRQTGTVKVDKHWTGGAAGEQPTVNLVVSGLSGSTTQVTGLANGTTGAKPVVTGTYSASETGLTAGWSAGALTCQRNGTGATFGPIDFVVTPATTSSARSRTPATPGASGSTRRGSVVLPVTRRTPT